jgi:hypothetical protein
VLEVTQQAHARLSFLLSSAKHETRIPTWQPL